jgi:hypothetical protein
MFAPLPREAEQLSKTVVDVAFKVHSPRSFLTFSPQRHKGHKENESIQPAPTGD